MATIIVRLQSVAAAWIESTSRRQAFFLSRSLGNGANRIPQLQQNPATKIRAKMAFRQNRASLLSSSVTNTSSSLSHPPASSVTNEYMYKLQLLIPTAEDMEDMGALLSQNCGPGDVLLLGGDLGAGKTGLSRGFVRARTGNADQRVTSPTYLLSNSYPTLDGMEIRHMDLYRLSGKEDDLLPLDLDFVFQNCISLIEWPSRLGSKMPLEWLEVDIRVAAAAAAAAAPIQDDDNNVAIDTVTNNHAAVEGTTTTTTTTTTTVDYEMDSTRYLDLIARGKQWEERLRALVDDGVLDDLLLTDGDNY